MDLNMKFSRKGFTLIELLVVIAIIAILAAILFPVFAQAKLAAKKTQAISNVKNIGTALNIYASDTDDVLPLTNVWNPANNLTSVNRFIPVPVSQVTAWSTAPAAVQGANAASAFYANSMIPYIKNFGIWDDPNATSTTSIYTLSFVGGMPYQGIKENFGYSMNGLLNAFSGTAAANPSTLIAFSLGGNRKTPGAAFANPALDCSANPSGPCQYVATVAGCTTIAGGSSFWSRSTGGAGWTMYGNGIWPVSYVDSHAKVKKMSPGSTGATDPRQDPMTDWAGSRITSNRRWWSTPNGTTACHAYMFRPDVDNSAPTDTALAL